MTQATEQAKRPRTGGRVKEFPASVTLAIRADLESAMLAETTKRGGRLGDQSDILRGWLAEGARKAGYEVAP